MQQVKVIDFVGLDSAGLMRLASLVRSGDPENVEAQAAKRYWSQLLGDSFRRDPMGLAPNGLLNYGYTVLRSAVARSIVAAGLHPSLGIHHSNDRNAFRLADDLIEPFRPFVDIVVKKLSDQNLVDVNRGTKTELAKVLYRDMITSIGTETLWGAIQKLVHSYVRCLKGEADRIEYFVQSFDLLSEQGAMLSGYRLMWLMVMFDLPVVDPEDRKAASAFRMDLLDLGFEMSQFSVYLRFCSGQAQVDTLTRKIEQALPSGGKVSVLQFTDKQYERVITFRNTVKEKEPTTPSQFTLF